MRISDWSSDVCSSDLLHGPAGEQRPVGGEAAGMPVAGGIESGPLGETGVQRTVALSKGWAAFPPETGSLGIPRAEMPQIASEHSGEIGRASCRERVYQ